MAERTPWDRDLRTYTLGSLVALVALVTVLAIGGMVLKHDRKLPRTIHDHGCYLWSDGTTQCARP